MQQHNNSFQCGLLVKICFISFSTFACLVYTVYKLDVGSRSSSGGSSFSQRTSHGLANFVRLSKEETSSALTTIHDLIGGGSSSLLGFGSLYDGDIILDWISDSDSFGYIHYKSLESLLTVYPKARVTVNLIAPNGAHYYKMGNLISKHYFQKYAKQGYRVTVDVVHKGHNLFRKQRGQPVPKGLAYWGTAFDACCASAVAADLKKSRYIPAHVYFYQRFLSLWYKGGMYTDFSWFHNKALMLHAAVANSTSTGAGGANISMVYQGAFVKFICPRGVSERCFTSTAMAFSAGHPVLACMLNHYEDINGTFAGCIAADSMNGGARCVASTLAQCFAQSGLPNMFLPDSAPVATTCTQSTAERPSHTSWIPFSHLQGPALSAKVICGIGDRAYHDALWKARVTQSQETTTEVLHSSLIWLGSETYGQAWQLPEEGSIIGQLIARKKLPRPGPYSAYTQLALPAPGSALRPQAPDAPSMYQYPLPVLARVGEQELAHIQKIRSGEVKAYYDGAPPCRQYQLNGNAPAVMVRQANISCALHFVVPGFMKAGTTFVFSTLMHHPYLLNTLTGVSFKETGCYMPENMMQSKSPHKYFNRLSCFPFVERGENAFFGDGTVWYSSRKGVPDYLTADNPDIKVVFVVRNPVHRAQSMHRFSYRNLARKLTGDMNVLVDFILDRAQGNAMQMYDSAVAAVEALDTVDRERKIEALVAMIQLGSRSKTNELYGHLAGFVTFSLYFPHIYHWVKRIRPGNIVVVPAELLKPPGLSRDLKLEYIRNLTTTDQYEEIMLRQRQKSARIKNAKSDEKRTALEEEREHTIDDIYFVQQFNRIFRFLHVPELTEIHSADAHHTGEKDIPLHHKLNSTTRDRLDEFYRPFNILLEDLLRVPLGYNDHKIN